MKILVTGLGSAGQRHVRNIKALLGDEAVISAYREQKRDLVIDAQLNATFGEKPEDHYNLTVFDNLEEALAIRRDMTQEATAITIDETSKLLPAVSISPLDSIHSAVRYAKDSTIKS